MGMEFRGNIIFSIVLHATIFTAALALAGRELSGRPGERFISVSLFEDHAEEKPPAAGNAARKRTTARTIPPFAAPREPSSPGAAAADRRFDPAPPAAITTDRGQRGDEALSANGPPALAAMNSAPPAGGIRGVPRGALQASFIGETSGRAGRQDRTGASAEGTLLKVNAIRAAIEKAKSYPPFARERGFEGTVTAEFTISAEGHPENIRILQSSGYDILDSAAKRTLLRASPFPPVPGRLEVPITFRLDR